MGAKSDALDWYRRTGNEMMMSLGEDLELECDLEPAIETTIMGIHAVRAKGPYELVNEDELAVLLESFLRAQGLDNPQVSDLQRLGGGASKEQFVFNLVHTDASPQRCVLRMDPLEGAALTSRQREFEVLKALEGVLPVPKALWVDPDGKILGRPALITSFIPGVTKPSSVSSNVSGFGTVLGEKYRSLLSVPFLQNLCAIHSFDIHSSKLASFQIPDADPKQAARWQVNWWSTVWRNDALTGYPLLGLAERWLRNNLPDAKELVLVHGDYRTGNYLFEEETGEITAILDWEIVHIGDYHQDLAWLGLQCWSHWEDGALLASGLMPMEELVACYTEATGREVDSKTLHFYKVLCLYQCVVICLGSSLRAAHEMHNHQDVLMSWVASSGHVFMGDLIDLLEEGEIA